MKISAKAILSVGVLLVGVALGVIIGSWQITVVAAALAILIGIFLMRNDIHTASITLREVRTELRNVREFRSRNAKQIEAVAASVAEVSAQVDAMRTGLKATQEELKTSTSEKIDAAQTETKETVQELIGSALTSVSDLQASHAEQRFILESLLNSVQVSDQMINKTKQQLNRAVRRQVEIYAMVELLDGRLTARVDQYLDEAQRELRKNRGQISALSHRVSTNTHISGNRDNTSNPVDGGFNLERYLYYLSYHIPREIEAQQQLQRVYEPAGLMPLLGGWALTPTGILDIVNAISQDRPEVVVECGSGTSTLWLALAVRSNGGGHIYALEHDPTFAEKTRAQLEQHGLSDFASVLDAPLVNHESAQGKLEWYDLRGLADVERIDVLVIDGPPQALGNLRGGAFALLRGRFGRHMHVFTDDVNRPVERELINRWIEEFPELHTEISSTPVQAHLSWRSTED